MLTIEKCSSRSSLIWVCTHCPNLHFRKRMIISKVIPAVKSFFKCPNFSDFYSKWWGPPMGLLETNKQRPSHGFVWNRGPPNGLLGTEAPPRVCWEQRNGGSYFRWWGTKEQMPKINEKRRRKIIIGNIGNQTFGLGEHGNSVIYFRGTKQV